LLFAESLAAVVDGDELCPAVIVGIADYLAGFGRSVLLEIAFGETSRSASHRALACADL